MLPVFIKTVEGVVHRHPSDDPAVGFDFNQVESGYGWVFPKGDHINVGLYTYRPAVPITRPALLRYAKRRLGAPPPARIRGYPLGVGGWRYRPGRGRVPLLSIFRHCYRFWFGMPVPDRDPDTF